MRRGNKGTNGAEPRSITSEPLDSFPVIFAGRVGRGKGFGLCANPTKSWGDPACSCLSSRCDLDEIPNCSKKNA